MPTTLGNDVPVTTIVISPPEFHRSRRWYLTTFATYLAAPCLAAFAVVCVALAEAHPEAMLALGAIVAGSIGPLLDLWRRRHSRAQRNDGPKGDEHAC